MPVTKSTPGASSCVFTSVTTGTGAAATSGGTANAVAVLVRTAVTVRSYQGRPAITRSMRAGKRTPPKSRYSEKRHSIGVSPVTGESMNVRTRSTSPAALTSPS